jgi:hypothetical protein
MVYLACLMSGLLGACLVPRNACIPQWDMDALRDSLRVNLTAGVVIRDFPEWFYVDRDYGVVTIMGDYHMADTLGYPPLESCVEVKEFYPLAWQRVSFLGNGITSVMVGFVFPDSDTSGAVYGLAIYSIRSDFWPYGWHLDANYQYPLQRYLKRPTNADVHDLIDAQLDGSEEGVEGPTSQRWLLFNEEGFYEWHGVRFQLDSAGICSDNWRAFLGESPLDLPTPISHD